MRRLDALAPGDWYAAGVRERLVDGARRRAGFSATAIAAIAFAVAAVLPSAQGALDALVSSAPMPLQGESRQ